MPVTEENVAKAINTSSLKYHYIEALKKGNDPTKRIIKLIRNIDKAHPNKNIAIGFLNKKNQKINSYFKIQTTENNELKEKEVLLCALFAPTLQERLQF